jgi:hypothetical protein
MKFERGEVWGMVQSPGWPQSYGYGEDLEHNWVFAWLTQVDGSDARMKGCSIDSI